MMARRWRWGTDSAPSGYRAACPFGDGQLKGHLAGLSHAWRAREHRCSALDRAPCRASNADPCQPWPPRLPRSVPPQLPCTPAPNPSHEGHHPDRCRRGRRPHPHPAAHLPLPLPARPVRAGSARRLAVGQPAHAQRPAQGAPGWWHVAHACGCSKRHGMACPVPHAACHACGRRGGLLQGYVYVGVPPLYKLEVGRTAQYCYTEEELKAATAGLAQGSYHVQRFKVRRGSCGGPAGRLAGVLHGARLPRRMCLECGRRRAAACLSCRAAAQAGCGLSTVTGPRPLLFIFLSIHLSIPGPLAGLGGDDAGAALGHNSQPRHPHAAQADCGGRRCCARAVCCVCCLA
jgi:hypothetical protein